jgi:hypothetical protein
LVSPVGDGCHSKIKRSQLCIAQLFSEAAKRLSIDDKEY